MNWIHLLTFTLRCASTPHVIRAPDDIVADQFVTFVTSKRQGEKAVASCLCDAAVTNSFDGGTLSHCRQK